MAGGSSKTAQPFAASSTGAGYTPSSRSHTGRPLTDAERRQRIAAARASADRRRKNMATARGTSSSASSSAASSGTAGLGNKSSAGFVDTNKARSTFESNGVSGADVNQRREDKSGFLVFAGKNMQSHQAFVKSLEQMGFQVAVGNDGSGIAINRAGQAVKLGAAGNARQSSTPQRRWRKVS